jgi:hypothetical protein
MFRDEIKKKPIKKIAIERMKIKFDKKLTKSNHQR